MQIEKIISPLGLLLCVAGLAMALPALVDLAQGNRDWQVFLISAFVAGGAGLFLHLGFRDRHSGWNRRDGFLFVSLSWLVMCSAGALPFYFAEVKMTPVDAFFESVSGLTTTGSTVMSQLDRLPPGILLWRSLLQWIGGVGIVVLSVFLFPFLKLGGQSLFAMESSDTAEKSFSRFEEYAVRILWLYVGLTLACILTYNALGMSFFDAANHAMATLSTGGYGTSDISFAKFNSVPILWAGTVFMFLGGMPFMFMLFMLSSKRRFFDIQIAYYIGVIAASVFFLLIVLQANGTPVTSTLLASVTFTVVSIITTTGFVFQDFGVWPTSALFLIGLLTFLGACSGSTAGGLKMFRIVVFVAVCKSAVSRLLSPSSVRSMKYGDHVIDEEVVIAVIAFTLLYFATFLIGGVILTLTGNDLITAFSGSATALANVGPGLGGKIGPAFNFAGMSDIDKVVLSIEMLLGRLEIMSVVVMFAPGFWRD
ncbi:MAG: TrkH family potassium uptake protein [Nitratireductor sp.]|nr:TrkH family potassium uptake protein [Nitratireductor sp.]